jgi:hypothetical protein
MAGRPSADWPEGAEFWNVGGAPAVIAGAAAVLMASDGTWDFVTPSGIRADGVRVDAARFDELVSQRSKPPA